MASQPLNTTISVQRRVRAYRQDFRHEAVKSLVSNGHRGLVVSVPGEEFTVGQTREDVSGLQKLVTTALQGDYTSGLNTTGLPVATVAETLPTVQTVYSGVANLDFPIRLPGVRDFQFGKSSGSEGEALFAQTAAQNTSVRLTGAE